MRLVLYFVIVVSGMLLTSLGWGTIPVTWFPVYPLGFGAMLDLRGILSFSGYVIHLFCLVAVLFAREGYPLALSVLALIVTVTLTTKGCNMMAKDYSRVASLNQGIPEFPINSMATPKEQSIRTSRVMTTPTSRPVSMISRRFNTNPEIDARPRW